MKLPKFNAESCLKYKSLVNINNESQHEIVPAISSIDKLCVNELQFDDLIWGSFADHFATEAKCRDKAEAIVKKGKPTHTVFCIDKTQRQEITNSLIGANKSKGGWMDNPPSPTKNITMATRMEYWTCTNTTTGINCTNGTGYPVVRVKADDETLREATSDTRCSDTDFYTPYHLQDIESA